MFNQRNGLSGWLLLMGLSFFAGALAQVTQMTSNGNRFQWEGNIPSPTPVQSNSTSTRGETSGTPTSVIILLISVAILMTTITLLVYAHHRKNNRSHRPPVNITPLQNQWLNEIEKEVEGYLNGKLSSAPERNKLFKESLIFATKSDSKKFKSCLQLLKNGKVLNGAAVSFLFKVFLQVRLDIQQCAKTLNKTLSEREIALLQILPIKKPVNVNERRALKKELEGLIAKHDCLDPLILNKLNDKKTLTPQEFQFLEDIGSSVKEDDTHCVIRGKIAAGRALKQEERVIALQEFLALFVCPASHILFDDPCRAIKDPTLVSHRYLRPGQIYLLRGGMIKRSDVILPDPYAASYIKRFIEKYNASSPRSPDGAAPVPLEIPRSYGTFGAVGSFSGQVAHGDFVINVEPE